MSRLYSPAYGRLLLACFLALAFAGSRLAAQRALQVAGVPEDAPFQVTAQADPSRLTIDLRLLPGWHAYTRDVGGGEPLTLAASKGSGFSLAGKPRLPKDQDGKVYGRVRIVQWLKPEDRAKPLDVTLSFMVCDPLQCLPPIELSIQGKVKPLKVLAVVGEKDARSARIEAFLDERGMLADRVHYADVTAAVCDGYDVVITDSPMFRGAGKWRKKARAFPKTKTPILAVGFLGTELIEGQGLAMTSGYI